MTSTEANKAIIRSYFEEMWNTKNTALIKKLVAESYLHHSSDGKITHGRTHVENVVEKVYLAFPDIHWTIKLMVAENAMVATYIEGDGTQISDGVKMHFKEAFYHRIQDGQIVEGWSLPVK
ncbi:MAG: ester cyclase [Pseudomonadota bacterium]|nr:ester cyclase [Pseudomonadota bacterium]